MENFNELRHRDPQKHGHAAEHGKKTIHSIPEDSIVETEIAVT